MPKRSCPFDEDTLRPQLKTHISEFDQEKHNEIANRKLCDETIRKLFNGARSWGSRTVVQNGKVECQRCEVEEPVCYNCYAIIFADIHCISCSNPTCESCSHVCQKCKEHCCKNCITTNIFDNSVVSICKCCTT